MSIHHDPLTGMLNRPAFMDMLTDILDSLQTTGERLAVIAVDTGVGTLGDRKGDVDTLLLAASEAMQRVMRIHDPIARVGVAELLVAVRLSRGLREDVRAQAIRIYGVIADAIQAPSEGSATPHVGFAIAPLAGADATTITENAEAAVRSGVAHGIPIADFDQWRSEEFAQDYHLLRMRHALNDNEFTMLYQPWVGLRTRQILGLRALLRWRASDGALLAPEQFLPRPAHDELIAALTHWTVSRCVNDNADLVRNRYIDVPVAVSVPDVLANDPQLVTTVRDVLAGHCLPADKLQLDFDTAEFLSARTHSHNVEELRSLGSRLGMGRAGHNFATLQRIADCPCDSLAIESELIRRIPDDAGALVIVEGIVTLARSHGVPVTATGVVTKEQHDTVRALGCAYGQGDFYAPAMPIHDLVGYLKRTERAPIRTTSRHSGATRWNSWHPPVGATGE